LVKGAMSFISKLQYIKMEKMKSYNIYGFTLNTNYDIQLAAGSIPDCFRVKNAKQPDLIVKQIFNFPVKMPLTCPPYIYSKNRKFVRSYNMGIPCKLMIDNLGGKTKLLFTPLFRRLFDIDKIISGVIQIKMLQKNMLMIHGALSLMKDDQTAAIFGWDKSGKTTFARQLGDVLSDDLFILKNTDVLPYPRKMRLFKNISPIVKSVPILNKIFIKQRHIDPYILLKKLKINKIIWKTKTSNKENFLFVQSLYHGNPIDSRNTILAYCSLCNFNLLDLEKRRMKIIKKYLGKYI